MDSGSHKDDGVEGFKVPLSPQNVPVVPEPTDFQEVNTPPHTSDDDDFASHVSDPITSESDSEESDSTDDSERSLSNAIYDSADGVYRCRNIGCGWEVAFGYCHGCQTKYVIEVRTHFSSQLPMFMSCCRMMGARRSILQIHSPYSREESSNRKAIRLHQRPSPITFAH